MLFRDYSLFLHSLHVRGLSEKTICSYKETLEEYAPYDESTQNEKGVWIVDLIGYRMAIKDLKKTTIARKVSTLRSFVRFLRDEGHKIRLLNDELMKKSQLLPKPVKTSLIFNVLHEQSFVRQKKFNERKQRLQKLQQQAIIALLYGLGLRIAELSSLEWKDKNEQWIRVRGKGNKTRILPLSSTINTILMKVKTEFPAKNFIFETFNGKKMNEAQLRYIVTKAFHRQNVHITPHQLRHSFASDMLNNGASILDVSELLGHAKLATTQIYTKLASATKLAQYYKTHPCGQINE